MVVLGVDEVLELCKVMIYCNKSSAGCVKSFRITPGDDLLDKCWGGGASLLPDFLRGGRSLTYWELSRDEEFFRVNQELRDGGFFQLKDHPLPILVRRWTYLLQSWVWSGFRDLGTGTGGGGGQGSGSAHYMAQLVRNLARPLTLSELFLRGPGSRFTH